jgi:hypothetical protein
MAIDFPSTPTAGQEFGGYYWDDTKEVWRSQSTNRGSVITSATTPTGATAGDMWFNTVDGTMFVYYDDGITTQWVEVQANVDNYRTPSQNYIINGGMDIWQRGDSVTLSSTQPFGPDRWRYGHSRFGPTSSVTFSRQAFTLGSFPVSGVKSYTRITSSESQFPGDFVELSQRIEDVTILAGKTVTFSFWANFPSSGRIVSIGFSAGNVSGGNSSPFALTTTSISGWNRYTATFNLPNLSGSTVSANNYFSLAVRYFAANLGETVYLEFTGAQLEEGTIATPFRRNQSNIQAELAACQRYYWRFQNTGGAGRFAYGHFVSTTVWNGLVILPVPMRDFPTVSAGGGGNGYISDGAVGHGNRSWAGCVSRFDVVAVSSNTYVPISFSGSSFPQFRPGWLEANGASGQFLELNAEL